MCWVMISTKFAVVQWESSVGGSPSTATFSTPPFLGVCARASSPVMATRPTTSSSDKPDRNPRLMANLPRDQALQLAGLAAAHHVLAAGRDLGEAQRVGAVDDGNDEAGLDGDGQADVDVGIPHDRAVLPRGIHARMSRQGRCDELHEKIRVGDPGAG